MTKSQLSSCIQVKSGGVESHSSWLWYLCVDLNLTSVGHEIQLVFIVWLPCSTYQWTRGEIHFLWASHYFCTVLTITICVSSNLIASVIMNLSRLMSPVFWKHHPSIAGSHDSYLKICICLQLAWLTDWSSSYLNCCSPNCW